MPGAERELGEIHRREWGYVVATLIRLLGDFELAEELAQEAFAAALEQWPPVPANPTAWLIQTARHKAVDAVRRRETLRQKTEDLALLGPSLIEQPELGELPDDRLRLIFTCCHPALDLEARVALTLRTLCGLTTEEIASAFLVPLATMAQRLVRAKGKIRAARIPYRIPSGDQVLERLAAVHTVIYLVFNEGYFAARGDSLVRRELCADAIQLARMLKALLESQSPAELDGLLALMLLHDSRSRARLTADGDLVLLEHQDRSRWNGVQIAEGLTLVEAALRRGTGPYSVQAAIAALHAQAASYEATDWAQIAELYDILTRFDASPVVALNRAVAVSMAEGPASALPLVDALSEPLAGYCLLHATRADLFRRLERREDAAAEYRRALALECNQAERRVLEGRLREVSG